MFVAGCGVLWWKSVSLCHTQSRHPGLEAAWVLPCHPEVAQPAGARPQALQSGVLCPHLCLQLFCSSLNFLLLGNEPTHPKGDSTRSRGLWVPEEHPDNMPDKGILLLYRGTQTI